MVTKKDNYNNVPVSSCKKCFSLKILIYESSKSKDIDYCGVCGSAEIESIHINEQILKYEKFHGKKLITEHK